MRAMLAAVLFMSGIAVAQAEPLWRRADAPPGQSPTGPGAQAWLEQDQAQCRQALAGRQRGQQQYSPPPMVVNPYPPQPAPQGGFQPRNPYPTAEQQEATRRGANNLAAFLFSGQADERDFNNCMASMGWQRVN